MAKNTDGLRGDAELHIHYEKDKTNKIAYLSLDRPDKRNAVDVGMRLLYADYILKANADDEVKVLVVRGAGEDFGSGGDTREENELFSDAKGVDSLLPRLDIDDESIRYPPAGSFRHLYTMMDSFTKARSGNRPLQEFKKVSIVEAKGYCYGWHFFQAADADLVVASDDALFGHPAFRYAGWAPHLWTWAELLGVRRFSEMLFTGRPFTAQEMSECGFVNSVVIPAQLEAEVEKYALACARSRPTDTVVAQKAFLELYKQFRGEYMGSQLTALVEGILPSIRPDITTDVSLEEAVLRAGISNAVKGIDDAYPPDWRFSRKGRRPA